MDIPEKIVFKNSFGIVSNQKVSLNTKYGWEEIPLKEISSISFERKFPLWVNYFVPDAIVLFVVLKMSSDRSAIIPAVLVGLALILLLIGAFYYIGSHRIILIMADGKRRSIRVEVTSEEKGRKFANAIGGLVNEGEFQDKNIMQ
jgi:hypothetical protein